MIWPSNSPTFQLDRCWHYDRFIRKTSVMKSRYESVYENQLNNEEDSIINQNLHSTSNDIYRRLLAESLSITPKAQPWSPMWPVSCRKNPCISQATVVLDLPNIRNDFCSSLLDWSSTDYLTVALRRSVYLWHAPSNATLQYNTPKPSCVTWNPKGTELFVASRNGDYKVLDITTSRMMQGSGLHCHPGHCYVTCSAFHPHSPFIVVGCSRGAVTAFCVNKGFQYIKRVQDTTKTITSITFSCDGQHFAVSNMTKLVTVYTTLSWRNVFTIRLKSSSRAVAWHPWKRSCLVAADTQSYMAMYDFSTTTGSTYEIPKEEYTSAYDGSILSLAFNPASAELVVSQDFYAYSGAPIEETLTQINVLASFDRVVDRLEARHDRVLFLKWNPDGTTLATSGTDETARIWDFFPRDSKIRLKKNKHASYTSSYVELGNKLGVSIR